MTYKSKKDGHEIRAVQNHPKFKEEYLSFMGDDGCVKPDSGRLWAYTKVGGMMLIDFNGWLVKDDELDEKLTSNGYTSMTNGTFREMYEPLDDPDFNNNWRVIEP